MKEERKPCLYTLMQSERAYYLNYFIIYIVWKRWRFYELMWNFLFDKATCVTIWYGWHFRGPPSTLTRVFQSLTIGKSITLMESTGFDSCPSESIGHRWNNTHHQVIDIRCIWSFPLPIVANRLPVFRWKKYFFRWNLFVCIGQP